MITRFLVSFLLAILVLVVWAGLIYIAIFGGPLAEMAFAVCLVLVVLAMLTYLIYVLLYW